MSVEFKKGIGWKPDLRRDPGGVLAGTVTVNFRYPPVGSKARAGMYVERFTYREGEWRSEGLGALYDSAGR